MLERKNVNTLPTLKNVLFTRFSPTQIDNCFKLLDMPQYSVHQKITISRQKGHYVKVISERLPFFEQSKGARNRVGIGLSYRPARLHRLAELIP
jgi:hypothetical protein